MPNISSPETRAFLLRDGGYLRLSQILHPRGPLPISKSSWWQGVRNNRYPQPVKLGPRITAWRCEDIRELLQIAEDSQRLHLSGSSYDKGRVLRR